MNDETNDVYKSFIERMYKYSTGLINYFFTTTC